MFGGTCYHRMGLYSLGIYGGLCISKFEKMVHGSNAPTMLYAMLCYALMNIARFFYFYKSFWPALSLSTILSINHFTPKTGHFQFKS